MHLSWRPRKVTRRIILHSSHLAPSPGFRHLDLMLALGRTMGLLEVGYHLVIERDGEVLEGRPLGSIGSHTPGCNHDSVGVCLAGGYEEADDYTGLQVETLGWVLARLLRDYPGAQVVGHTELQRYRHRDLVCPAGIDMDALRAGLSNYVCENAMDTPQQNDLDRLTPQQRLLVEYMRAGRTCTTQIAITSLGIMTLSKRISELRAMGFNRGEEWAEDHFERRYKKYTMRGTP